MSKQLATCKGILTIRAAVPADAVPLRELRLEALANHPVAFAADHDLTHAQPAETWAQRIRDNEADNRGVICIAASGNRLVGMTGLGRGHWPKTQHSAIIWGVYVNSGWRGLGLVEALMNECIAWGQANGVTIVKLGVVTTNTPAIHCYTRSGFTVYGIDPQVISYDGVLYDELLMARVI
jgi:RimJ/RimL family protein N-acetyltransferase